MKNLSLCSHEIKQKLGIKGIRLQHELKGLSCIPLEVIEINKIKDPINKAKEILDKFGLGKRLNNLPSQLSGGEQQRVAIARSIVMKPELILADEPTGNLDSENSELISNILFDYVKEENASLIMVTHDNKLANLSKRIIIIKDCKIE